MLSIKYPDNGQCWIIDEDGKCVATVWTPNPNTNRDKNVKMIVNSVNFVQTLSDMLEKPDLLETLKRFNPYNYKALAYHLETIISEMDNITKEE